MYHLKRSAVSVGLIIALLALASCAPTLLDRAKQSAAISYEVYESISNQVVSEILIIVAKDRAGVVTDADRERLIQLDELRQVLDSYAAAHNLYVVALQTWEATDQAPTDTIRLESQMRELIYRGINLAWELGLRVPPTLS